MLDPCQWNPAAGVERSYPEAAPGDCPNEADVILRDVLAKGQQIRLCDSCATCEPFASKKIKKHGGRIRILKRRDAHKPDPLWPVLATLVKLRDDMRVRMDRGLEAIETSFAAWPEETRQAAERTLVDLAHALVTVQRWLMRLPDSNVCICRKCRKVVFPAIDRAYKCCGVWWSEWPRFPCEPLPIDFWAKHDIGSRYGGNLEPFATGQLEDDGIIEI